MKSRQDWQKPLKQQGFKFIGSTTCYAFMQAVGMVNDHLIDCDFHKSPCIIIDTQGLNIWID